MTLALTETLRPNVSPAPTGLATETPSGGTPPVPSPPIEKTRRFQVRHRTTYTYDKPVEHSVHHLHLRPLSNTHQRLLSHSLRCEPVTSRFEYEDVFGNATTHLDISQPYTHLEFDADSLVEIVDEDPFAFTQFSPRFTFPLAWMPWESTMLAPYLTPMELPETQMRELVDYGMSFVERNNRDLMETLFALNLSIFREYQYSPGSTALETTPFDVLTNKRGVCQDFSNLLICLARLLGVPARYVCGYIHCPQLNHLQSLQSHAWVELYIPKVGWKGFDPTNGVLPRSDHVRVAVGRHYVDTAPTAGTIYSPAVESMVAEVTVREMDATSA